MKEMGIPTVGTRRVDLLWAAERVIELLIDEIRNLPYTTSTRWAHGATTHAQMVLEDIKRELDGIRQEEEQEEGKAQAGKQTPKEDAS